MSTKTKKTPVKSKSPQKATPVHEAPKAAITPSNQIVARFSIKNGVVIEDNKGTFVKFVDFKAVHNQNINLVKTGDKLIATCERQANAEIERVLNGLFAVMTVTVDAMNLLDLNDPKRDKLVNKLVKIGEKIGFDVKSVDQD
jgi:hypothetical protein